MHRMILKLTKIAVSAVSLLSILGLTASAAEFEDYPAEIYTGKTAPIVLDTPEAKEYRTLLTAAASGRPNFAGHYILATWGCGNQCTYGAAIDAKTGLVIFLPGTICCSDDKESLSFRKDSAMLILGGLLDENGEDSYHRFVLADGRFTTVSE